MQRSRIASLAHLDQDAPPRGPEQPGLLQTTPLLKRKSRSLCKEPSQTDLPPANAPPTRVARPARAHRGSEVSALSPVRICSKGEVCRREQLAFQIGQRAIQRTKEMSQCPTSLSSLRKLAAQQYLSELVLCGAPDPRAPAESTGRRDRSPTSRPSAEKLESTSLQTLTRTGEQLPQLGNSRLSPASQLARDSCGDPEQPAQEIALLQRTKGDTHSAAEHERKSFRIGSLSPRREQQREKKSSFEIRYFQRASSRQLDALDDSSSPMASPDTAVGPRPSKFALKTMSQARLISPVKVLSGGCPSPERRERLCEPESATARLGRLPLSLQLDRIPGFSESHDGRLLSDTRRRKRSVLQPRGQGL